MSDELADAAEASKQEESRCRARMTKTTDTGLNLSNLNISIGYGITSVLTSMYKLQTLNLQGNQLSVLPQGLDTYLTGLHLLNLSKNRLTLLPAGLFHCKLKILFLNGNALTSLPAIDFDAEDKCSELEELYLQDNKLETLPDVLGHCMQLRTLNLRNNRIAEVPPALTKCTNLSIVDLSGNDVRRCPQEIARLHDKHALLHSAALRKQLISRASAVRKQVKTAAHREMMTAAYQTENPENV
jgi:Leucine-rich repeat (LRR) protein